jgi:hypothetical protein
MYRSLTNSSSTTTRPSARTRSEPTVSGNAELSRGGAGGGGNACAAAATARDRVGAGDSRPVTGCTADRERLRGDGGIISPALSVWDRSGDGDGTGFDFFASLVLLLSAAMRFA